MGTFRVELQAVGGHGCSRDKKDGEIVIGCRNDIGCVDCITRDYVGRMKLAGAYFVAGQTDPFVDGYARITHWPGTPTEVVDNLLTGVRKGSF